MKGTLFEVKYFQSSPSANRLRDFRLLVTLAAPSNPISFDATDVCAYHRNTFKAGQAKILPCRRSVPGRYVVVTKNDISMLTLCEVEVFGDLSKYSYSVISIAKGRPIKNRSGQVRYGCIRRSSASPLRPYSFGLRLAIAQADARPAMYQIRDSAIAISMRWTCCGLPRAQQCDSQPFPAVLPRLLTACGPLAPPNSGPCHRKGGRHLVGGLSALNYDVRIILSPRVVGWLVGNGC